MNEGLRLSEKERNNLVVAVEECIAGHIQGLTDVIKVKGEKAKKERIKKYNEVLTWQSGLEKELEVEPVDHTMEVLRSFTMSRLVSLKLQQMKEDDLYED